jgi:hypothetical protein
MSECHPFTGLPLSSGHKWKKPTEGKLSKLREYRGIIAQSSSNSNLCRIHRRMSEAISKVLVEKDDGFDSIACTHTVAVL